jgi:outer membrane protein TolC
MWTLQGTVQIPLSDYLLRLSQNHASASKSKRAAEVQEKAARVKSQLDAKIAFFNWIRAQGGVIVAEQGLATATAHLKDVKVAEQVGSASRADLLAVEGQVASTELLVESSKNMAILAEEQLRVMMHDPETTRYRIGEDTNAAVASETTNLRTLYEEALRQRLERRVIEETVASLRETRKVLTAGNYPRLDAFGNLYHSNPNTRVFPQQEKWSTTWDVGVQLSWTINDTFTTGSQVGELDAKIMEIEAQRAQLDDGIRLQVTQAYNALREGEVAKQTTERQLVAAEESYRVRRELFRAGRATSSEMTDAEMGLLKAGFDAVNARIDIRVARENLDHALGRDAVRP